MALVILGMGLAWAIHSYQPLTVIWTCRGGSLAAAVEDSFLIADMGGLGLWNLDGVVVRVEGGPAEALAGKERLLYVDQGWITVLDHKGILQWTAEAHPRELLLRVLSGECVLSSYPAEGGKFGEAWVLRLFGHEGQILWSTFLPAAPFLAAETGDLLYLAGWDLSLFGHALIACVHRQTGRMLWQRAMEASKPGLWRNMYVTGQGSVIAVLNSKVQSFSGEGLNLWSYTPSEPVTASAVDSGAVYLGSSQGSAGRITALSLDGKVLWKKALKEAPCVLAAGSSDTEARRLVLALGRNSVIASWAEDGKTAYRIQIRGYPLAYLGGAVLIEQDDGVCLVKLEERPGMR